MRVSSALSCVAIAATQTIVSTALLSSPRGCIKHVPRTLPLSIATTLTPTLMLGPRATTTSLSVVASACQQAAIEFFTGIRFPSSLIAGSSVTGIFSLVNKAKDTSGMSRLEVVILRLYHAMAILSLCLSMVTITTATTACTHLLLTSKSASGHTQSYVDIYHFLRADFNFEFVLTRWAFFSSLVCYLTGVGARILLELDLLKPKRQTGGVLVVSVMTAATSGILSNINLSLNCWPNLLEMTVEVVQLIWQRVVEHQGPLQFISVAFTGVALACLLKLFLRSINNGSSLPDPLRSGSNDI